MRRRIRTELDDVARRRALQGYEIPRDFILEREAFSKANHLLTDSGKPATGRLRERCAAPAEQDSRLHARFRLRHHRLGSVSGRCSCMPASGRVTTVWGQRKGSVSSTRPLWRFSMLAERKALGRAGDRPSKASRAAPAGRAGAETEVGVVQARGALAAVIPSARVAEAAPMRPSFLGQIASVVAIAQVLGLLAAGGDACAGCRTLAETLARAAQVQGRAGGHVCAARGAAEGARARHQEPGRPVQHCRAREAGPFTAAWPSIGPALSQEVTFLGYFAANMRSASACLKSVLSCYRR